MPGALPAQQDADPAEAAGAAGPAEQAESAGEEAPHPPEAIEEAEYADADETAQPGEPEEEDDGPRPLGLRVEPTGHAPVDVQLRRLEDADHLAVSGHLEVYEDVHRGLREALAGLDRHADPSPVSGPASAHGPGRPVPGPQYPRS